MRIIIKFVFFAVVSFKVLFSCSKPAPATHFEIVKELEQERILKDVDTFLNLKPITVTANFSPRSAGTKNDFYSEGDYWWPNSIHPDSAYIRKDGLSNPDNFVAHRQAMIRLSQISGALASAYLITNDEKYINHLVPHLKAWFVDASTKMNPNLMYAQAIKGRVTGRGIGIIDTIHLIEVALAVEVIEQSKVISKYELEAIKAWFSQYLEWLTTHEYGKQERYNGNNHSTCWAMQVAAFARLTNNQEQLEFCEAFFKNTLLPEQMDADGSFPKELSRTKPYGYSIFNLDAMVGLAQLLKSAGNHNIFNYKTSEDRSLKNGIEFMYPYLEDKTKWPYQKDVMYWDDWPTKHPALLFCGLELNNKHYTNTWETLPAIPNKPEIIRNMPIRYPLLWVNYSME